MGYTTPYREFGGKTHYRLYFIHLLQIALDSSYPAQSSTI